MSIDRWMDTEGVVHIHNGKLCIAQLLKYCSAIKRNEIGSPNLRSAFRSNTILGNSQWPEIIHFGILSSIQSPMSGWWLRG